jgi:S-adenosylmethionine uptake transporter
MTALSLVTQVKAAAERLPASVKGALWMIAAAGFFAGLTGMIRYLSEDLHPFEIAFFRNLFGLMIMVPWLMRVGVMRLRTKRLRLYTWRGLTGALAMLTWFYALSLMPLADAVALSFTSPLFATAGAALFLSERVGSRRWSATAVGFIGAMLILRPGPGTFEAGAMVVLVSAAAMAATALMVKDLSRTEPVDAVVVYTVVFMTPLTALPALFVWQTPDWEHLIWLVALGAVGTLGNIAAVRAFAVAEASALFPYDFVRLPFVALIGFLAFSEIPDRWTWIGAGVIALSSLYIAHREARLERKARRAAGGEGAAAPPPERA